MNLSHFLRVKTRSKAVWAGAAAGVLALAVGWVPVAGFLGHQASGGSGTQASARLGPQTAQATNPAGNTSRAASPSRSSGPSGSSGIAQPAGPSGQALLGPDGTMKPARAHGKTACPSVPPAGSTINGGLVVKGTCTITGVTINGGVVITGTGHLTLYKSTVNGGTDVQPGGEFDSDLPTVPGGGNTLNGGLNVDHAFDLDIYNSTVQGRTLLNGGPTGFLFTYTACGSTFGGDMTVISLSSGGAEIGDFTNCAANTITGSLHIRDTNGNAVEFERIHIGGSVDIWNSHPALAGNIIGGSLICHQGSGIGHYDSDDSNANTVHGANTCS